MLLLSVVLSGSQSWPFILIFALWSVGRKKIYFPTARHKNMQKTVIVWIKGIFWLLTAMKPAPFLYKQARN